MTVSIAALTSGTLSRMLRVSRVRDVDLRRQHGRVLRHEQDVVERQRGGESVPVGEEGQRAGLQFHDPHGADAVTAPGSVALLVLLSAAAGTRIVAADLRLLAADRLDRRRPRRCAPASGPCRAPAGPATARGAGRRARFRMRSRSALFIVIGVARRARPDAERPAPPRSSTGRSHRRYRTISSSIRAFMSLEEIEALALVLDERIALPVSAKADAFLQVIERIEVILPLRIHDLQHDVALDAAQQLGTNQLFLLLVARLDQLPDRRRRSRPSSSRRASTSRAAPVRCRRRATPRAKCLEIPFLEIELLAGEALDLVVEEIFGERQQVRARVDELLLASGESDPRGPHAAACRRSHAACSSRRRTRAGACGRRSSAPRPASARVRWRG